MAECLSILQLVAPGQEGGLEHVVRLLARGLSRRGHAVQVAAVVEPSREEHPFVRSLRTDGVAVYPIVVPTRAYLRERRATADLCRRLRPDVIHVHGYRPAVLDAGVARRLGIPVVSTAHGFTGGDWKNRLYERLQRVALRHFDAVVAVSRPLAEQLAGDGVPRECVHFVPNAWEATVTPLQPSAARQTLDVPADRFHVGWVGRLTHEKGADVLVEAVARLRDLPLAVSVIGDGPARAALAARAADLEVDPYITWHGTQPDAARLFPAFDAFVLSSRTEGTPIVLFEAMAAGVPIVAARVGGVPDVVSSHEAVLVAPDDPGALAAQIRAVSGNPASARARALRARQRLLTEFTVGPWLDRYTEVYRLVSRATAGIAV